MKMYLKYAATLIALLCRFQQISAQSACQTCMSTNDAYCVDATSYYLCLDGKNPSNSTLSTCGKGKVCTDSVNICEPEHDNNGVVTKPICGSSCGVCPDSTETNMRYTCVSKTQFGRCVDNAVTLIWQCEDGSLCSSELYAQTGIICAPQCVADFYGISATCNSDEIVLTSTTTTTPSPVSTENIKEQCEVALPDYTNSRFFYIRNSEDTECKTYIYCEKFGNDVDALLINCANGYFDQSQSKCVNTKPSDCGTATTTASPTTTTTTTNGPTITTTSGDSTTSTTSASTTTTTSGHSTTTTTNGPTITTTSGDSTTTTTSGPITTTVDFSTTAVVSTPTTRTEVETQM